MSTTLLILLSVLLAAVLIAIIIFSRRPKADASAHAVEPAPTTGNDSEHVLPLGQSRVVSESEHQSARRRRDDRALNVVHRLQDARFQGYLVGGCIRALLLLHTPKDFNSAPSAQP